MAQFYFSLFLALAIFVNTYIIIFNTFRINHLIDEKTSDRYTGQDALRDENKMIKLIDHKIDDNNKGG